MSGHGETFDVVVLRLRKRGDARLSELTSLLSRMLGKPASEVQRSLLISDLVVAENVDRAKGARAKATLGALGAQIELRPHEPRAEKKETPMPQLMRKAEPRAASSSQARLVSSLSAAVDTEDDELAVVALDGVDHQTASEAEANLTTSRHSTQEIKIGTRATHDAKVEIDFDALKRTEFTSKPTGAKAAEADAVRKAISQARAASSLGGGMSTNSMGSMSRGAMNQRAANERPRPRFLLATDPVAAMLFGVSMGMAVGLVVAYMVALRPMVAQAYALERTLQESLANGGTASAISEQLGELYLRSRTYFVGLWLGIALPVGAVLGRLKAPTKKGKKKQTLTPVQSKAQAQARPKAKTKPPGKKAAAS